MSTHPNRAPRTNHGNRTRFALGALLLALGGTQVGCVIHSHPRPVYVVEQPAPAPQTVVLVEDGVDNTVVVDDFYEPLSYYGTWVWVPGYGRVWQPAPDMAGERFTPYMSHGRWVLNANGDWVFVSRYDSQWGWATYHYGRWVWTDYYGWVWMPGRAWAPAWVEWRYGGGYVGWVPMGPPGYVVVEEHWVFVERSYVSLPTMETYRLPPERARTAYVAASPMVEIKGDSKWKAGPPSHEFKAAGIELASAEVVKPQSGWVKAQAKATVAGAAERKMSGRVSTEPYVRPGTTVAPGAGAMRGNQPPPAPAGAQAGLNNNRPGLENQPGMSPNNGAGMQPGMSPNNGVGMQPGMSPNNGAGMQPGMSPNNGAGMQPGMSPQPSQGIDPRSSPMQPSQPIQPSQPSGGLDSRPSPMPQPAPQPTVQPRPQPMPQPAPSPRPSVSPSPSPRPTAAPAPKPAPRPTSPPPRPAPSPKRRK